MSDGKYLSLPVPQSSQLILANLLCDPAIEYFEADDFNNRGVVSQLLEMKITHPHIRHPISTAMPPHVP